MGLAGFTLADRLGAKSSPCTVAWLHAHLDQHRRRQGRQAGRARRSRSVRPDVVDVRPVPRGVRARARRGSAPATGPAAKGPGLGRRWRRSRRPPPTGPPPRGLCAGCEGKLARSATSRCPARWPGCTRTALFSRRAQLLAGAPDATLEAPALRCAQCESVYRKLKDRAGHLRHQRLQAQVALVAPTSRSRPTPPACRTSRRGGCARAARPSSAPSPTARFAAARPAARTPGPGSAATSWTTASPASRPRRRRAACARAASRFTRRSRTSSAPAAARAASGPGPTSAARSWRGRCAARPAIRTRSTARSARRRWASSRTGRSPARPRTAKGPGPGPSRPSWRRACGRSPSRGQD